MPNVLLVTERFCPPWSDGTVSYARGLTEAILETNQTRKDLDLTILAANEEMIPPNFHTQEMKKYLETESLELKYFYTPRKEYGLNFWRLARKLSKSNKYDLVHIIVPGLNPLWVRMANRRRNPILKHIFIYPFHSTFKAEKLSYNFFQKSGGLRLLNIDLAFSSRALHQMYTCNRAEFFPSTIDTNFFRPRPKTNNSYQTLMESTIKFGNAREILQKDVVLLYMGPLLSERFDWKSVIGGFIKLRREHGVNAGLVIVGRELENLFCVEPIKQYVHKNHLDNHVFLCAKNLNEAEKICLFNDVDVFVYPFSSKLRHMSVVFPPIALLETMSAGLSVVTGGLSYMDTLIENLENGILLEDNINSKTFAEAMFVAITNKRKFSYNARLTIKQNFSIKYVSGLYSDLLSKKGI